MQFVSGRVFRAVVSAWVGITWTTQLWADKPANAPGPASQPAGQVAHPLNRPPLGQQIQPQHPADGERAFKVVSFAVNCPQVSGVVHPSAQLVIQNIGPDVAAGGTEDLVSADYQFFDEHHTLVYVGAVSRGHTGARHDEVIPIHWGLGHSLQDPTLAPHFATVQPGARPATPRPAPGSEPPPAPVEVKAYTVVVTLHDRSNGRTYDHFEQTVYAKLPPAILLSSEPAALVKGAAVSQAPASAAAGAQAPVSAPAAPQAPVGASADAQTPTSIFTDAPVPTGAPLSNQDVALLRAENENLRLKLENTSLRAENQALRAQLQNAARALTPQSDHPQVP